MALGITEVVVAVIVGTLFAIVWSLRVLILLERRVAGMEQNLSRMTARILKEEQAIESMISSKKSATKTSARSSHKRSSRKRASSRKKKH